MVKTQAAAMLSRPINWMKANQPDRDKFTSSTLSVLVKIARAPGWQ
jgi:hypothetical protein